MGSAFQFHKGTIRTFQQHKVCYLVHYFNSIKVQLEHRAFLKVSPNLSHFNSIKVQLEHSEKQQLFDALANFNSIKVQLERFDQDKVFPQ